MVFRRTQVFRIYKSKKKDKILAMIQIKGQEPQIFMVQNLPLQPPKPKQRNDANATGTNNPGITPPTANVSQ